MRGIGEEVTRGRVRVQASQEWSVGLVFPVWLYTGGQTVPTEYHLCRYQGSQETRLSHLFLQSTQGTLWGFDIPLYPREDVLPLGVRDLSGNRRVLVWEGSFVVSWTDTVLSPKPHLKTLISLVSYSIWVGSVGRLSENFTITFCVIYKQQFLIFYIFFFDYFLCVKMVSFYL